MTTTTESWQAAIDEGLSYFWFHMHIGHSGSFVGTCWEDGGFHVNEDGEPVRDNRGNTVAKFSVEELDRDNAAHVSQVDDWFG